MPCTLPAVAGICPGILPHGQSPDLVGYMARPLLALNRILPARLFDRVATSQIT